VKEGGRDLTYRLGVVLGVGSSSTGEETSEKVLTEERGVGTTEPWARSWSRA